MRTTKNSRGRSNRTSYRDPSSRKLSLERLEPRRLLSVDVLTWHNDLARDGLNSNETILTPADVNASTFGELLSYPVTGQVYAQPLYVSNLAIPGLGTVNVVFVATENNDVYAFNADSNAGGNGGLIWHVNLGLAAATPNDYFANRYGPYHDINPQVGITGTPVIDLSSDTLYVDAFTNDVAGQNVYSHHIHALNIFTGQDRVTPMLVSASVAGNGVEGNGTTVSFDAEQQLQRPALTLLNGMLYVAYGSYADSDPYHGWILGFNPTTLQLVTIFNDSPNLISTPASSTADEAGIWQSGAGLASDGTNLFFMTANGDFSTPVSTYGDYGDSILKVVPDSSTAADPNINGYGMHVVDYFTPYNQLALSNADEDLGSGGAMLLPTQPGPYPDELVGSGKEGTVYLVNRDNMGQYSSTTDNVIQEVSLGHGNWDSPAYFNETVYYHAVGDVLKGYSLTNGLLSPAPAVESTDHLRHSRRNAQHFVGRHGERDRVGRAVGRLEPGPARLRRGYADGTLRQQPGSVSGPDGAGRQVHHADHRRRRGLCGRERGADDLRPACAANDAARGPHEPHGRRRQRHFHHAQLGQQRDESGRFLDRADRRTAQTSPRSPSPARVH